jgi:hypothetical protein
MSALLTGLMLALAVLAPATVSAANTRLLYIGDPSLATCDPLSVANASCPTYLVHPTPVSPGNVTYFDVLLKNLGKQTLTSAGFGIGTLIAQDNGSAGPALPAGWKITNVTSLTGAVPTCVTDQSSTTPATGLITPGLYDGLSCNFGNLAKGAGASIRVFLQAGSTLAHDPTWRCFDALTGTTLNPCPGLVVSGKVAEAVGGNVGGNNNTFYAYGDERSPYFVSGAGLVAGLFSKQHIQPASHVAGTALTTIDITPLTGDYVVTVDEVSAGPTCPASITTCSTNASTAHVNFGAPVSPYFVWTVLFPVDPSYKLTNKTGFIHFHDDYNPTNPKTYDTLLNTTKNSCQTRNASLPCADFSLLTTTDGTFLQVIYETTQNGSGKYF